MSAFRFGLGHPALELVATLAGRRRGEPVERLATPERLGSWLAEAGFGECACSEADLVAARDLREATYRLIEAARGGGPAAPGDVALLNRWAAVAPPAPQLDAHLRLRARAAESVAAALGQLARASIELLTGSDVARIRNCADPTCSLMFIDHSRPGRRRWCSMERCGNKSKTSRYRQRTRVRERATATRRRPPA
jgi:predicted RNA-binding Zn ribbon-like protein